MDCDLNINLAPKDIAEFYSKRRLTWIPPHFTQVETSSKNSLAIVTWIYTNTEGRFAIVAQTKAVDFNPRQVVTRVGFELEQDALLFTLSFT